MRQMCGVDFNNVFRQFRKRYPVSKCGEANVFETLDFYKHHGYDGVFITNHFVDGNINIGSSIQRGILKQLCLTLSNSALMEYI